MAGSEILTSFVVGLLATTSPCVFPLYPGYLAYLAGQQETRSGRAVRYLLGVFVLAGVLTMMVALGALIAALSVSTGQVLRVIVPLADGVILLLGILLLANINLFKGMPVIQVPVLQHPLANAYLYGLLYGPIALPCSAPLIVSIFALSLTVDEALGRLGIFLWFGLGFGTPLLLLSWAAGRTQRAITRFFARHSAWVNRVGGVILIAIALYDLWINWENIFLV
jgi:cytochrome c-type biogenesis protein